MGLKQWKNGQPVAEVDVHKKSKKVGGANVNMTNGKYSVDTAEGEPQLFIKAETDKRKEFSELLAGAFISKITAQPGFAYADNFAIPRPGVLSQGGREQIVIVQDIAQAEDINPSRIKLTEFLPGGNYRANKAIQGLDVNQFACAILMSALIADYSVHTGNFMKQGSNVLRIDFGSGMKNILKKGNDQELTKSPPGTKFYKNYIELWTTNKDVQVAAASFMVDNEQYFDPKVVAQMMVEACDELFNTVYKDAPIEDLLVIYQHLTGEKYPYLSEQEASINNEIVELKAKKDALMEQQGKIAQKDNLSKKDNNQLIALGQQINALDVQIAEKSKVLNSLPLAEGRKIQIKGSIKGQMKEGMEKRAENLIKEAKELGLSGSKKGAKEEKETMKEYEAIAHASYSEVVRDMEELSRSHVYDLSYSQDVPKTQPYIIVKEGDSRKYLSLEAVEEFIDKAKKDKNTHPHTIQTAKNIRDNIQRVDSATQIYREAERNLGQLEKNVRAASSPNLRTNAGASSSSSSSSKVPRPPVSHHEAQNATAVVAPSPATAAGIQRQNTVTDSVRKGNKL